MKQPPEQGSRRPVNDVDDSGTDTDDEGRLIQQAAATAKRRTIEPPRAQGVAEQVHARPPPAPAPVSQPLPPRAAPRPLPATTAKGKAAPKRPAGAITLRTLLDAGFLVPGCKVLYVEYKGLITWADLTEEGSIVCDGTSFESPSAFSIFVKRKLNPERKADDGWKAVKYAGKLLEHFKEQYLRQQLAASGLGSGGALRGTTPSGSIGPSGGMPAAGTGPSPHSSVHQSPQRYGAGEMNGTDEDGPPSKRQRTDGEGDALGAGGGGLSRPGLKIKLKLKDGPGAGAPTSGVRLAGSGEGNGAVHARPGPLLPLCAPAVAQVPCGEYAGSPGSGEPGAQPWRLEVSDMVNIVMDFHAHCSATEVGGLLAGSYDEAARILTIARAFPVLETPQKAETTTAVVSANGARGEGSGRPPVAVEFDATDLARVREVIKKWGLQCVGSYRSHPAYSAQPNSLDVAFAARSQQDSRTPQGTEPYVCAILAPYDPSALDSQSGAVMWFHVEYDKSKPVLAGSGALPAGCRPMALAVHKAEAPTAHMDIMNLVSTQFQHTARTYAMRPTRAPLMKQWQPASVAPPGSGDRAGSYLDKLVSSVVSRLPEMFEGDLQTRYGNMVRDMVLHEFSLAERVSSGQRSGATGQRGAQHRGSEDGGGNSEGGSGWGAGGCLAVERSRRPARVNGAVVAAARFDSDEEETEEDDDEVKLDDEDEALEAEDDEI